VSDDFLSDLSSWWRTSWQAGVNAPSVGPNIGRGLFSNWALSERDRELQELKALHAQMLLAHQNSPFSDSVRRDSEVQSTFQEVFGRCDIEPTRPLLDALYGPIEALLNDEFFSFPDVRDQDWDYFDLKTKSELRADLLLRERLYNDVDYRLDLGRRVIGAITAGILSNVSEGGLNQTNSSNQEREDALVLTTSLIDLAQDAGGAVEALCGTLLNGEEVIKADLFCDLRLQLARNLFSASGIDENDPSPNKKFIHPAKATDKTAPHLVESYLGATPFEDLFEAPLPISIPDKTRCEHSLIVGGSGHGKSQLLLKLIHHDLSSTRDKPPGVIVIDSQGDLIHTISRLALFDPERAKSLSDRLILIDPNDVEFPVALNLFSFDQTRIKNLSRADKERVLHSVIDLYEYFFSALLGAELTQKQGVVFRYLARLMLAIPDATIQTLRALMEDGKPFKQYMESLDGSAKRFFKTEFFSPGFSATKKQILRRLWGVLANPVFERMFSHPENKIDIFEAMNDGKIILINTAKDLLKSENCSIFGRFFIAKIAQAALERATQNEADRRSNFVYIDEAHDYFDETLEQLFNQARKYNVGLHVAVQHLDQMPARLRSTVMASTSLKFAGGVSAKDARALSDDMQTDADFITAMRKRSGVSEFAAFVKNRSARALRINVELGTVNGLPTLSEEAYQALIDNNRAQYCATLDEVEAIIELEDESDPSTAYEENVEPTPKPKQRGEPKLEVSPTPKTSEPPTPNKHGVVTERQTATPESKDLDAEKRTKVTDHYTAGVGGKEHTRLQQLVRTLAHERGFKATIEKPVLDGKGSVDVALERDTLKIAFEISISTSATHETGNVLKCFKANFDEVVLIVPKIEGRGSFAQSIDDALTQSQLGKFKVLGPEEIDAYLDDRAAKLSSSETTVRGYRVTTKFSSVTPEEARQKRETIAKVVAGSGAKNESV